MEKEKEYNLIREVEDGTVWYYYECDGKEIVCTYSVTSENCTEKLRQLLNAEPPNKTVIHTITESQLKTK